MHGVRDPVRVTAVAEVGAARRPGVPGNEGPDRCASWVVRPDVLWLRDLGRNTRLSSQSPDCLGHELAAHGAGVGEPGDDVLDQPGRGLAQLLELELPELGRHLAETFTN